MLRDAPGIDPGWYFEQKEKWEDEMEKTEEISYEVRSAIMADFRNLIRKYNLTADEVMQIMAGIFGE